MACLPIGRQEDGQRLQMCNDQVVAILVAVVDPNAEERLGGCLERVETRFIEPSESQLKNQTTSRAVPP